jgi:predicted O-methyltransferase YrrM
LKRYTATELGAVPLRGPFSRYLSEHETAILAALVNSVSPKVMIEFGCNAGITAARMLENVPTLERYIGVDIIRRRSNASVAKSRSARAPMRHMTRVSFC